MGFWQERWFARVTRAPNNRLSVGFSKVNVVLVSDAGLTALEADDPLFSYPQSTYKVGSPGASISMPGGFHPDLEQPSRPLC